MDAATARHVSRNPRRCIALLRRVSTTQANGPDAARQLPLAVSGRIEHDLRPPPETSDWPIVLESLHPFCRTRTCSQVLSEATQNTSRGSRPGRDLISSAQSANSRTAGLVPDAHQPMRIFSQAREVTLKRSIQRCNPTRRRQWQFHRADVRASTYMPEAIITNCRCVVCAGPSTHL